MSLVIGTGIGTLLLSMSLVIDTLFGTAAGTLLL